MNDEKLPATPSSADEVNQFLAKIAATPSVKRAKEGRLIFALDATASRQPTWDRACQLQGEMFTETAGLGGLSIQLVWYRGFGKFEAGPWVNQASALLQRMGRVYCEGGLTQIKRVLNHAINETRKHRINALVFIGDCVEEDVDQLCHLAGELGVLGVPVFIFHEGGEVGAARAFQQISRLSHGAYCPLDSGSARQLRELLTAVAVYVAGGRTALENLGRRKGGLARQLTHQMK